MTLSNIDTVLSENKIKLTSLLKVKDGGTYFIQKKCSPDSPPHIKSSFERETVIYNLKPLCAPKLYDSCQYSILVEYIDGETLGDILFRGDFTSSNLPLLFRDAITFYKSLGNREGCKNFKNYYRYLRVLSCSGPVQTKELPRKNNFFSRRIRPKVYEVLGFFLSLIIKIEMKSGINYMAGYSHSDFHYNNIIQNNHGFYFFDFERSELSGNFYFDLIFLLTIIDCLKFDNGIDNTSFNAIAAKLLNSRGKRLVFKLFKAAVRKNPRFFFKMKVIKNTSIYLGASLISKGAPFILLPFLTEYLPPEEFGILAIFLVLNSMMNAFVGMSMHANVTKNFFSKTKSELGLITGNVFFVLLITTSFYCLVMLIVVGLKESFFLSLLNTY
ncbi:oligosaccharide flippase family protein [Methylophaga thalassica]